MAGWMKTPLGTEVDLGPGHNVLDGDPAPSRKGHSSPLPLPLCGSCLLWPRSPISATAELLLLIQQNIPQRTRMMSRIQHRQHRVKWYWIVLQSHRYCTNKPGTSYNTHKVDEFHCNNCVQTTTTTTTTVLRPFVRPIHKKQQFS